MDGAAPLAEPAAPAAFSPPAAGLSRIGRRVLLFVQAYAAARGVAPTFREIMEGCDFASTAPIQHHVDKLVALGHLAKRARSSRGLDVIRPIERLPSDGPAAPVLTEATRRLLLDHVGARIEQLRGLQKTGLSVDIAPWLDAKRDLETFKGWTP